MPHANLQLDKKGRVALPAKLRAELGFATGDTLHVRAEQGRLVLETTETIEKRLLGYLAHVPKDVSLVDELIAERRLEFEKECREMDS